MTAAPSDPIADLDQRIAAAYAELSLARASFYLSPSGEIVTACEAAEDRLNDLLDLRYALVHGRTDFPAREAGSMRLCIPPAPA